MSSAFLQFIVRWRNRKLWRQTGPARIEYGNTGNFFLLCSRLAEALFFLPFLGVGAFLLFGSLVLLPRSMIEHWPPQGWEGLGWLAVFLLMVLGGLVFGGVGFWGIFGNFGTIMDREASAVTLWWGIPFVRRSEVHDLAGYTGADVRPVRGGGFPVSHDDYNVFLTGPAQQPLEVASGGHSREHAERLAAELTELLATDHGGE